MENNITLASFLEHHEVPFRQPDLHPMNIIDLDIGPRQRTMKHTFSIPNLIKEHSQGHTYTSRIDPSIREEFDFTAGISNYLLMTEQEAQTDWHQDFTGISVLFIFVEGKERILHREANPESQTVFWRMSKECMEKVCKKENSVTSFQVLLKIVIFSLLLRCN